MIGFDSIKPWLIKIYNIIGSGIVIMLIVAAFAIKTIIVFTVVGVTFLYVWTTAMWGKLVRVG